MSWSPRAWSCTTLPVRCPRALKDSRRWREGEGGGGSLAELSCLPTALSLLQTELRGLGTSGNGSVLPAQRGRSSNVAEVLLGCLAVGVRGSPGSVDGRGAITVQANHPPRGVSYSSTYQKTPNTAALKIMILSCLHLLLGLGRFIHPSTNPPKNAHICLFHFLLRLKK